MARQIIGTNIEGMPLSFLVWNTETLAVEFTRDNGNTFEVIVANNSRDDISFTSSSLSDGKLTVPECAVGSCCVIDNNGWMVMPGQQQSGTGVVLDLSGFTVTGTWKVKFVQGKTGGMTPEYVQQLATTYAIIFGS